MNSLIARALALAATVAYVVVPATAHADPPAEVDQSQLVPSTLDSAFAPFTCRLRRTGPVCTGERHLDTGWQLVDFPCEVPIHNRYVSDRWSTRYYDNDYLNYDRRVRMRDVDYFSTTPGGPATATIISHVRFREPFAVPGDDSTFTVVTTGTILDIGPVGGSAVLRVVGTLVEPPGETGTFTGHVTRADGTTRYVDAPYDEVLPEDEFLDAVCRATTGG